MDAKTIAFILALPTFFWIGTLLPDLVQPQTRTYTRAPRAATLNELATDDFIFWSRKADWFKGDAPQPLDTAYTMQLRQKIAALELNVKAELGKKAAILGDRDAALAIAGEVSAKLAKLNADIPAPMSFQALHGLHTIPPDSPFYGGTKGPRVKCITTKGEFVAEIKPDWAPLGARRLLDLVRTQFFTNIGFFRVNQWITQFGADYKKRAGPFSGIRDLQIKDDPNPFAGTPWHRGVIAFCGGGPNTRTSQLLVVIKPNYWGKTGMGAEPDATPVGRVISGMEVFDKIYAGYGDPVGMCPKNCEGPNWDRSPGACSTWCNAPDQGKIFQEESYLPGPGQGQFPDLDYLLKCTMLEPKT